MSPEERAYGEQLEPHRRALHAHCYRMLGSVQDAEDAVQETLTARRRTRTYRSARRWPNRSGSNRIRTVGPDRGLGIDERRAGPEARYEQREAVELAFIAALQHLPPRQRAVLILRDVLGFSGEEVAAALEATPASVYSLLQRAHASVDDRLPERSQQQTLRSLGDERLSTIVDRYVDAWARNDVDAIVEMLTEGATAAMPPFPNRFRGREAFIIGLRAGALDGIQRWRLLPTSANGQLAMGAYRLDPSGVYVPNHLAVLSLSGGRIDQLHAFHDASAPGRFGLPPQLSG